MALFTGILNSTLKGLLDSVRGGFSMFLLDKKIKESCQKTSPSREKVFRRRESCKDNSISRQDQPTILLRIFQCCLLNGGVFWISLVLFDYVLMPSVNELLHVIFDHSPNTSNLIWSWMGPFLSWTFRAFWVLPLFLLSKIVNSLWFQDIADSAYRFSRGRPQIRTSVSMLVADSLFSVLVQATFLVQSMLVSQIPITPVGEFLYLVHMSMLYSLYAFEYKWVNSGWELHKRLTYIEVNWPYFLGFGLPLAMLTSLPNSYIISGCVFSILFPLFIISANEAEPVSGACDIPLQLFSPVVAVSNAIFNKTIGMKNIAKPSVVSGRS